MADGQITIRMSADLKAAAEQIRDNKRAQQEMADALGVSVTEYRKIERELQRKQAAEKKATAEVKQHATAQRQSTAATQGATLATRGASVAMQSLGVATHAALGPLGIAIGVLGAIGAGTAGAASKMSSLVDEVANLAEGTGLSQRQIIAMRHAVASAGGDFSKAQAALSSFNKVMADDLAGKTGPEVDRVLRQTIARIEAIADPADRAAERMRIFGTRSSIALAGLTSGGLESAAASTSTLADRIERAAGSSAAMDKSNAALSTSLTELTVVLGDKLAPNVTALTDSLTGLVKVTTLAADAGGGLLRVFTPPGLAGVVYQYAAGVREASQGTKEARQELERKTQAALADQRAIHALMDAEEELRMTREGPGYIAAPQRQEGETKEAAARRKAAIAAARKQADDVAKSTKAVKDKWRQDDFAEEVAADADRKRRAKEGALRLLEIEEQERIAAEQAHADTMRRLAEEEAARIHMARVRQDAIADTVGGLADLVAASTASAEAIAAARIMETLAYGSVAFGRALAEVGPIAGIPIAIGNAAAIAAQIAAVKSAPSRHMGGPAPDEGVVRVRNNERVTFEPATKRRDNGGQTMATLTIDNQAYRAMARRSARQDSIFGQRRREAVEVGR